MFTRTPDTVGELRDVLKEYLVNAGVYVTGDTEVQSTVESIDGLPFELFQKMKEKAAGVDGASVDVQSDRDDLRPFGSG